MRNWRDIFLFAGLVFIIVGGATRSGWELGTGALLYTFGLICHWEATREYCDCSLEEEE